MQNCKNAINIYVICYTYEFCKFGIMEGGGEDITPSSFIMTEIKMELLFLRTHQGYWSALKNIRSLFRMAMSKEEGRTNKQINQQTTLHIFIGSKAIQASSIYTINYGAS